VNLGAEIVRSVDIVLELRLDGQVNQVQFWAGVRDFSFLKKCSDRLYGQSSLLSNGYRGSFPGNKAAGAWIWLFTSFIACVKNAWSSPPCAFMALCL